MRSATQMRDRAQVDSDGNLTMDERVTSRDDVFRPVGDGRYRANASKGVYGDNLPFQAPRPDGRSAG